MVHLSFVVKEISVAHFTTIEMHNITKPNFSPQKNCENLAQYKFQIPIFYTRNPFFSWWSRIFRHENIFWLKIIQKENQLCKKLYTNTVLQQAFCIKVIYNCVYKTLVCNCCTNYKKGFLHRCNDRSYALPAESPRFIYQLNMTGIRNISFSCLFMMERQPYI